MIKTTYSHARENLASLLDQVTNDREIAIIKQLGRADVALVSADELSGLLETGHLLRSPANAKRLLTAICRSQSTDIPSSTLGELRGTWIERQKIIGKSTVFTSAIPLRVARRLTNY
jgi:antitoxin YefM